MNRRQVSQMNQALASGKESADGVAKALKQEGFKNEPELLQKPFIPTRRTQATIRVMRSFDFCHFEESITLTGEDITLFEIDNARKDAQRLCDKAVGQYKTAKENEFKRTNNAFEREQLEKEVAEIHKIKEEYHTPEAKAKIKALADYKYRSGYNYDDDDLYHTI